MMDMLNKCGLSITTVDRKGNTLLMIAANKGQKAAAECLLQHGVSINADNNDGHTALHAASAGRSNENATIVELLLAHGADVHKCTNDGTTALDIAAYQGNKDCARVLIAAGADIIHANSNGYQSLHQAIVGQQSAVVQLLLEHGATAVMNNVQPAKCYQIVNGTACCCTQATALMMCCTIETVKVLLAAGADVHVTNDAGDTCLHLAARHKLSVPVICLLIKAGADLHAVNNDGKTAAQIAHDVDNTLIEQILNRAAQQQER
jgi:uncharacterized protein